MLTQIAAQAWNDEIDPSAPDLTELHRVYMSSIRLHQRLVGELCTTLSSLGVAIDNSPIGSQERDALAADIGRHVDLARDIIAGIESALTCSTPTRPSTAH